MCCVWADNKTHFTQYPPSRAGCSDWRFSHSPSKTQGLLPQECGSLLGALNQGLFHELHLWCPFSLCKVKIDVNGWGMIGNCKTYQGRSYFSKLLFPGSSDSPKFAFVPCSIYHWGSTNSSIIPGWCYGCWQADCEGWLNTCYLILISLIK